MNEEEMQEITENREAEAEALDEEVNQAETEELREAASSDNEKAETAEALQAQIKELREQLKRINEEKEQQKRALGEIEEFSSLFPDVALSSVPDSVWEGLKSGGSLAAHYALYERRLRAEEERISKINLENAAKAAGKAGVAAAGEYFSPDEVRKMSPKEVHTNYSKIKESMKTWL